MENIDIFDKEIFHQFVLVNSLRLLSKKEIAILAFSLYERSDKDEFHTLETKDILEDLKNRQKMRSVN